MDDRSLGDSLEQVISVLARRLKQCSPQVSSAQKSVIGQLSSRGPMTVSQLARALGVAPPTMTRMIDSLEERSLVRRARDKRDRRVVYAVATREGSSLLNSADGGVINSLVDNLSESEKSQAAAALDTLNRLFCREPSES
ncbi:MAG: MarR family transcriptional regulator [Xanthomonadales bacterium]|nr:MarR family transcriptional regulator [Xanthomonadales bacterium]